MSGEGSVVLQESPPTTDHLGAVLAAHARGEQAGITSVCSAHPLVLAAAMMQAAADGTPLLVEATSNQVDQFGGYTGRTPAQFRDEVLALADEQRFPRDRLVLGGDHLGPNPWQSEPAEQAMVKAVDLVAAYAAAGYVKIHLDCSMPLGGDAVPVPDDVVAARAARLLVAAEAAAPSPSAVRYVIGTEVPVPGGAHETIAALTPTTPDAARATLAAHEAAFRRVGHADVWPRVMALVVQPGVEFDHLRVVDYRPAAALALSHVLDDEPDMVFEAHSTDYQTPEALDALVRDHWAVLKVGPGLTFALREALFALSAAETQLVPAGERADLPAVLERRMLAEPARWQRYYEGDAGQQRFARRFSYSDRARYYWPDPEVQEALDRLLANLDRTGVPEPLLSQVLPLQYARLREGAIPGDARSLVLDHVRDALRPYAAACAPFRKDS